MPDEDARNSFLVWMMSVANPYSVILFNFRGSSSSSVILIGRKDDGGGALVDILKDTLTNHDQISETQEGSEEVLRLRIVQLLSA